MMPALLIRMSRSPVQPSAKARIEARSARSRRRTSTSPSRPAAAASPRAVSRTARTTRAPAAASARAVASPRPLFAPVMTAVRPVCGGMSAMVQGPVMTTSLLPVPARRLGAAPDPGRGARMTGVSDSGRTYDLVVYGATGFVGRLLAAYLADHAPSGIRIALAGRSRARGEEVRAGLPAAAHGWPVLEA